MDDSWEWKKNNQLEEQSFRSKRMEQVLEKVKVPCGPRVFHWSTEGWTHKGKKVIDLASPVILASVSPGIR